MLRAQNLRRSAAGRLESGSDLPNRRADLREVAREIRWTPAYSVFESMLTLLRVARLLTPGTYRNDIEFAPAWFASIRLADSFPRWRVDKIAFQPDATEIGPFGRRREADSLTALLEDAFDLCRYPEILEKAPHGEACDYFDMGRCPAPCDGSIPMTQYRASLDASIQFASGVFTPAIERIQTRMNTAAAAREFALAARLRDTLDRATKTMAKLKKSCRILNNYRYLIIQRGPRRSQVKPFFLRNGHLDDSQAVPLAKIEKNVPQWLTQLQQTPNDTIDARHGSEHIWLVAHFVAKVDRGTGLFLHADEIGTPDKLVESVRLRFVREKKTRPDNAPNETSTVDAKN